MTSIRRFAAGAALVALTGCASSTDVKKLEMSVTELQDQISQLRKSASSKEDVQRVNEQLGSESQRLVKSNADMSVKVSEIDDKMQNLQGTIEQTNYRIDRIVQQVTQMQRDVADLQRTPRSGSPAGTAPAPGGVRGEQPIRNEITVEPPSTPSEDPLEVYQTAYRDYQKGNYELARQGFQDFLKTNSNSDLSDNASYWIGETWFSQKKYREAIQQFDKVINSFPKSDKVPGSLLKKGYAYIEIGEKAQGIVQLQYVLHEHPKSPEAALAKQKLKAMGIDSK
ncbi:MAG TPA: tol-pal system protein YbgF [Thermoanaerobaculia bacterium]|nr:tol-pal system protein YbgF [Thermoanaerobaculia bacterium]